MKRLILAAMLVGVFALIGCTLPGGQLVATINPMSGHPLLEVVLTFGISGVTYLVEIGTLNGVFDVRRSFHTSEGQVEFTLYELPSDVRVTNEAGASQVLHVALENQPPVIHWPLVNGNPAWYDAYCLRELDRYFFDFTPRQSTPCWPGDPVELYGIHDPEGDECRITNVTVLWYGDGFPNGREVTVYTPPHTPGVYHAVWRRGSRSHADIVENAFILYPSFLGELVQTPSRMTCPQDEWTYFWDSCAAKTMPSSQPKPLVVKVEGEDKHGAHVEETFEFVMDATGCAI